MTVLGVIPCRAGSKGIPGKNFKMLAGKPLYEWTVEAAVLSNVFDLTVVSSDGGLPIPDGDSWYGCSGYRNNVEYDNHRPPEYATDAAQLEPLLLYYANKYKADVVCLLQPTSPLRSSSDIREAYKIFSEDMFDSLLSVESLGDKYWLKVQNGKIPFYNPEKRMNRQNPLTNMLFYENGAIYFCKKWLLDVGRRIGGSIGFYEMSQQNSHQIDSEFDWKVCECVLQ